MDIYLLTLLVSLGYLRRLFLNVFQDWAFVRSLGTSRGQDGQEKCETSQSQHLRRKRGVGIVEDEKGLLFNGRNGKKQTSSLVFWRKKCEIVWITEEAVRSTLRAKENQLNIDAVSTWQANPSCSAWRRLFCQATRNELLCTGISSYDFYLVPSFLTVFPFLKQSSLQPSIVLDVLLTSDTFLSSFEPTRRRCGQILGLWQQRSNDETSCERNEK